jgi:nickel/cobalt exporter
MMMVVRRIGNLLSLLFMLGLCRLALAHPMGNFSVNHYSGITVENDRVRVRYFIDLAEIPTYQELQQANLSTTTIDPNSPAVINYMAARGAELGHGLDLDLDGKSAHFRLISCGVIFPPGAGGLPTMKMGFVFEAVYPPTLDGERVRIHYADKNYPGHTGWKEIVALASVGSLLRSSVPAADRSDELSNYPTDLLSSPPQDLEASLVATLPPLPETVTHMLPVHSSQSAVAPTNGVVPKLNHAKSEDGIALEQPASTPIARFYESSQPVLEASSKVHLEGNRQQTPRSRFTQLIQTQNLSAWFLFTAALIALGLGGLHALEPGHGKTIVAAYLIGSKGTARHAFLLGIIVTASHTVGVFALGVITLYASRYIVPEQLYPWLGALSGVTIAGLGCYMLLRRLTGTAMDHSHASGASLDGNWRFWERPTQRAIDGSPIPPDANLTQSVSLTQLCTLGITGGIIPCPAALIVLLSAFALHRIGLGFLLILAFSVGLAAVLILFGLLMVYACRFLSHLQIDGPLTKRWLPICSSAFITVLGLMLTIQAFSSVHLDAHLLSRERLGPVLFVTGLGLILGMRHSTDADHVVAISTIVSKQRSIRNAAVIGSVWGLGHTITVFIVGSLIILFGVEIPPRLGLSMEFSVAVMLILLGVLNLTGVLQKVTNFLTPTIATPTTNTPPPELRKTSTTKIDSLLENSVGRLGLYQCLRPLVIGLVHGLAGSAAVALLVLSTIQNPVLATGYLLIFGAGTMIGMMCMTAAIAVPLTFGGDRFTKMGSYLGAASGMASLCFGTFLVYQLGFLGGLFTNHPQWTPR